MTFVYTGGVRPTVRMQIDILVNNVDAGRGSVPYIVTHLGG
jgi:hypothetical protein